MSPPQSYYTYVYECSSLEEQKAVVITRDCIVKGISLHPDPQSPCTVLPPHQYICVLGASPLSFPSSSISFPFSCLPFRLLFIISANNPTCAQSRISHLLPPVPHLIPRFLEKMTDFFSLSDSSLFIRIFHSHPFSHSFTPTLTLGRSRKHRARRRGRY